MFNKIVF